MALLARVMPQPELEEEVSVKVMQRTRQRPGRRAKQGRSDLEVRTAIDAHKRAFAARGTRSARRQVALTIHPFAQLRHAPEIPPASSPDVPIRESEVTPSHSGDYHMMPVPVADSRTSACV
jgi:hypothetical protein